MRRQHSEIDQGEGLGQVHTSRSVDDLQDVIDKYPDYFDQVKADTWLESPNNVAIRQDDNYGLFHRQVDGIYTGHYFFDSARGKRSKELAIEMIDHFFDTTKEKILRGLTPEDHKAARWMSRQVGFDSYGLIDTDNGPCELFIMIRK